MSTSFREDPSSGPPDAGAPFVLPLAALDRSALAVAGSKGANLGALIGAGFPVPLGFVITTAAYDRFVAQNALADAIVRALADQPGVGASIRAAFERAPIPPEIARAILAAYEQLGSGPVAVRSSATAEDLPEAAFAGQQDTFLNVVGDAVGSTRDAIGRPRLPGRAARLPRRVRPPRDRRYNADRAAYMEGRARGGAWHAAGARPGGATASGRAAGLGEGTG
jgi:hypothetical protein